MNQTTSSATKTSHSFYRRLFQHEPTLAREKSLKSQGNLGKKQHQFGSPESCAIAAKKVLNQSLSFCALGALDHSSRVRGFKKSDPWRGSIEVACIDSLSFALKLAQMPNRSDQAIGF